MTKVDAFVLLFAKLDILGTHGQKRNRSLEAESEREGMGKETRFEPFVRRKDMTTGMRGCRCAGTYDPNKHFHQAFKEKGASEQISLVLKGQKKKAKRLTT